jgi:hypothetical protein
MKQVKSSFGKFNWRDLLHGFVVAFLTASCTGLLETINSGHLPTIVSIKVHAQIGLTAGIGYVLKVVLENSNGQLLKKDEK